MEASVIGARIDPGERVPAIAWPTVALFTVALTVWAATVWGYLAAGLSAWVVIPVNTIVSFVMFTVLHDCSHTAVSSQPVVNKVLGRLSIPFVSTYNAFPAFRFIHMQHHLHTNEDRDHDPDAWISHAPAWQLPLRWFTMDAWYGIFYLKHASLRPRAEKLEFALLFGATAALIAVSIPAGFFVELAVLYLIPQRLAMLQLAWWFDWLPHHALEETHSTNKFRATRNRIGLEWLLTPAMLAQNYHLIHHVHPVVPFYRYLAVWRRNEEAYLERTPALSKATGGELTAEEYRQRRGLDEC